MAKFHGKIGYSDSVETVIPATEDTEEIRTGVWTPTITERDYSGDVIRESKSWNPADKANDNLAVNNRLSIVADNFAYENFSAMRYAIWNGVYWMVTSIEVQRPRLILTLGGVYNGPKAEITGIVD